MQPMGAPRQGFYDPLNPLSLHSENRYRDGSLSLQAETESFEALGAKIVGRGFNRVFKRGAKEGGEEVGEAATGKGLKRLFGRFGKKAAKEGTEEAGEEAAKEAAEEATEEAVKTVINNFTPQLMNNASNPLATRIGIGVLGVLGATGLGGGYALVSRALPNCEKQAEASFDPETQSAEYQKVLAECYEQNADVLADVTGSIGTKVLIGGVILGVAYFALKR